MKKRNKKQRKPPYRRRDAKAFFRCITDALPKGFEEYSLNYTETKPTDYFDENEK